MIYSLLFFLPAFVSFFLLMGHLIPFLKQPLGDSGISLYFMQPEEKFLVYCKLAFIGSLIAGVPFILSQLAIFVAPALRGKEKRFMIGFLLGGLVCFLCGCFVAWKVLIPWALRFFLEFSAADGIKPMLRFVSYADMVSMMVLIIGVVFLLPVMVLALVAVGWISSESLRRYRKIVIVGIFVLAAILTPADAISQIILASILLILYELVVLLSRTMRAKHRENEYTTDPDELV